MLQPRPVELRLERFSLLPLPLVADGAAVAMDALIDNFFFMECCNQPREMLHPVARDVTTDKFFCWNQPKVLSLIFFWLEPVSCFATTGGFICYYRRQRFFAT